MFKNGCLKKWLFKNGYFFGCVPTAFFLALHHPCLHINRQRKLLNLATAVIAAARYSDTASRK